MHLNECQFTTHLCYEDEKDVTTIIMREKPQEGFFTTFTVKGKVDLEFFMKVFDICYNLCLEVEDIETFFYIWEYLPRFMKYPNKYQKRKKR